jgi:hypothetical protein
VEAGHSSRLAVQFAICNSAICNSLWSASFIAWVRGTLSFLTRRPGRQVALDSVCLTFWARRRAIGGIRQTVTCHIDSLGRAGALTTACGATSLTTHCSFLRFPARPPRGRALTAPRLPWSRWRRRLPSALLKLAAMGTGGTGFLACVHCAQIHGRPGYGDSPAMRGRTYPIRLLLRAGRAPRGGDTGPHPVPATGQRPVPLYQSHAITRPWADPHDLSRRGPRPAIANCQLQIANLGNDGK